MNREAGAWQIIFSRVSNASKERISTSTSLEFGFWKCERCIDISFEIHELIVIKSRPMNREARAVQGIFGTVSVASKACSSTLTCLVFGFWKCEKCIDISFEIHELIIIKSREMNREAGAWQIIFGRVSTASKECISTLTSRGFSGRRLQDESTFHLKFDEIINFNSRETDREARSVQARSRRVFPEPKEFVSTVKPMVFGF
jgi:hypothetical protein